MKAARRSSTADYADLADIFLTGNLLFPIRVIRVIRGSGSRLARFGSKWPFSLLDFRLRDRLSSDS
jgi:hypothetical protein